MEILEREKSIICFQLSALSLSSSDAEFNPDWKKNKKK